MTNEELFQRLSAGDASARDEIILQNQPLIMFIIKRKNQYISDSAYDTDDLFSIGTVGLLKAVDSFDEAKGQQFSTYAAKCIINELYMTQRKMARHRTISLDNHINSEDGKAWVEIMADRCDPMEKRVSDRDVLKQAVREIEKLEPREREIMAMHINGLGTLRQTDIAKHFGITQSYCSRIIKSVQRKLRVACEYEQTIGGSNQ